MDKKKDFYSLNSEIIKDLSVEALEERLELVCWYVCGYNLTCETYPNCGPLSE